MSFKFGSGYLLQALRYIDKSNKHLKKTPNMVRLRRTMLWDFVELEFQKKTFD